MERIETEVDKSTAMAFSRFSPETKSRFNEMIAETLKKMINEATTDSHKKFLNSLSDEAERNGLTEDILNDLMKTND